MVDERLWQKMRDVRRLNRQAAVGFVRTELMVARTNTRIAKTSRLLGYNVSAFVEAAKRALHTPENRMWEFRLQHYEFDQMVAMSELVRMELAVLEDWLQSYNHREAVPFDQQLPNRAFGLPMSRVTGQMPGWRHKSHSD
jgi:hypothetical protein